MDIPPDSCFVFTLDGGRTFNVVINGQATVSPYVWPTALRRMADRIERTGS